MAASIILAGCATTDVASVQSADEHDSRYANQDKIGSYGAWEAESPLLNVSVLGGTCRVKLGVCETVRDQCEKTDLPKCKADLKKIEKSLSNLEKSLSETKAKLTALLKMGTHSADLIPAFERALKTQKFWTDPYDDNYDGETAKAVKALQKYLKVAHTGWATPKQIRDLICIAGVADTNTRLPRNDDFESRMLLAIMYTSGVGYPMDEKKAKFLVQTIINQLAAKLNGNPTAEQGKRYAAIQQGATRQLALPILENVDMPPGYRFKELCPA